MAGAVGEGRVGAAKAGSEWSLGRVTALSPPVTL